MYKESSVLGFIPARGGSKGVPGKNIKPLAGKPLIAHTIDAARESGIFDYLVVSTDQEEIAETARQAGADVPFLRPAELATDTAKGMDVLHHAMKWLERRHTRFDWVMCLQPTSPLRSSEDIVAACHLMRGREAQAVVSVCQVEHHPWWSNTLPADLCMRDFLRTEAVNAGRQQLPLYYRLNGAIYLAEWDFLSGGDSWYGPRTFAYVMPGNRSIDIDSDIDFMLAEVLISGGLVRRDSNE